MSGHGQQGKAINTGGAGDYQPHGLYGAAMGMITGFQTQEQFPAHQQQQNLALGGSYARLNQNYGMQQQFGMQHQPEIGIQMHFSAPHALNYGHFPQEDVAVGYGSSLGYGDGHGMAAQQQAAQQQASQQQAARQLQQRELLLLKQQLEQQEQQGRARQEQLRRQELLHQQRLQQEMQRQKLLQSMSLMEQQRAEEERKDQELQRSREQDARREKEALQRRIDQQQQRLESQLQQQRLQEQLEEQKKRVWTGLTCDAALSAAACMERGGALVHGVVLLEGLLASDCPMSAMEGVRVRLALGDLYAAYTTQHDRARRRFLEAGTLLDQLPALSARALLLRILLHLRLAAMHVRLGTDDSLSRAAREVAAAKVLVEKPSAAVLCDAPLASAKAWIAVANLQLILRRLPTDACQDFAEVEMCESACRAAGGREHILSLLIRTHLLLRYGPHCLSQASQRRGPYEAGTPEDKHRHLNGSPNHLTAPACLHSARQLLIAYDSCPPSEPPSRLTMRAANEGSRLQGGDKSTSSSTSSSTLWKYLTLLTALDCLSIGDLEGIQTSLLQLAAHEHARMPPQTEGQRSNMELVVGEKTELVVGGDEEELMWWHGDGAAGMNGICCYLRSITVASQGWCSALDAMQHTSHAKSAALEDALAEVKRGLALLEPPPPSQDAVAQEAGSPCWIAEKAALTLLLQARASILCLWRTDFENALKAICGMMVCMEELQAALRPAASEPPDLVRNCGWCLHCAISVYLWRAGDRVGAEEHLLRAMPLVRDSRPTDRLQVLLQHASLLLDTDTPGSACAAPAASGGTGGGGAAHYKPHDLLHQAEKIISMLNGVDVESAGLTSGRDSSESSSHYSSGLARDSTDAAHLGGGDSCHAAASATCLFLRAQCLVREHTDHDSNTHVLHEAKELLERCIELANVPLGDFQVHIKALVLLSDTLLELDSPEEAREYLGQAHARVSFIGDEWLELRVLRGLERCYLRMPKDDPHSLTIARASNKVKASRERSVQAAIAKAVGAPMHTVCRDWMLQ